VAGFAEALVFRFADERGLPLADLEDLRAVLTYLDSKEGKADLKELGGVSGATIGVLLRSLVALEDGGGTEFFGEPQFEIADLRARRPTARASSRSSSSQRCKTSRSSSRRC